jgi:dihydroflavonol-4-reductase
MKSAFVTGATGLLGSNLVRALVERGVAVRALVRSRAKGDAQLADVAGVEIIEGDMTRVDGFAPLLEGSDVVFHTAAHFRDSYKGGNHRRRLVRVNVDGTRALLNAAYDAGVRKMIYTSSIAVLNGPKGASIDEAMLRAERDADDYYRSKILAEREVISFLREKLDMHGSLILPGWMHGPGDAGPTSAGQVVLDFVRGQLPGIVPASFSVVDARDVAAAMISAVEHGRRGERYLAAGRHMTMAELFKALERVSGVKAPTRRVPLPILFAIGTFGELAARATGRGALLSLATVRLMIREGDRSRFDHTKSERELGVRFRPVEETLADEISWYRAKEWLPPMRNSA